MAIKKKAMCIDLDAEENIYHLKVKCNQVNWITVKYPQRCACAKMTWKAGESLPFLYLDHLCSCPLPDFCLIASSDQIAGAVRWVGVEAAAPPPLSAKWDLHVPQRQVLSLSSLPVPRLTQQGWERVAQEGTVSQREEQTAQGRIEATLPPFKIWTRLYSVLCLWHFSQEQNLIEATFGSLLPRSACPYGDSPRCRVQLLSL